MMVASLRGWEIGCKGGGASLEGKILGTSFGRYGLGEVGRGKEHGRSLNSPNNCRSAFLACSRRAIFRCRGRPEKSDPSIAELPPGREFVICEDGFGGKESGSS